MTQINKIIFFTLNKNRMLYLYTKNYLKYKNPFFLLNLLFLKHVKSRFSFSQSKQMQVPWRANTFKPKYTYIRVDKSLPEQTRPFNEYVKINLYISRELISTNF